MNYTTDTDYSAEEQVDIYLSTQPPKESELDSLPENLPLYKDSGLWQLRSDNMETVLVQQGCNESINDFIARCINPPKEGEKMPPKEVEERK